MELLLQDDEALVKLENAAIERSKAVDSAVLGKYSIWRKENENENSDMTVRLMRDQMIMARVYLVLAKSNNKNDIYQELQTRLKESQRTLGEATMDADLHHRQVLAYIRVGVPDMTCVGVRLFQYLSG
jgi:alpha-1,4-galacturonosyltransferase